MIEHQGKMGSTSTRPSLDAARRARVLAPARPL